MLETVVLLQWGVIALLFAVAWKLGHTLIGISRDYKEIAEDLLAITRKLTNKQ